MKHFLFIILVLAAGISTLKAQESQGGTCEPISSETYDALQSVCEDIAAGEICTLDGERMPLADVSGPALIQLPGTADTSVHALLSDGASLTVLESGGTGVRLPVRNKAGFNVNLRGGPGTGFDQVGVFGYDRTTEADGRSSAGDWLRILTGDGTAWIAARFLTVDGDTSSLPVVEGDEPVSGGPAFILSAETDCAGSGLLLDYAGESSLMLQFNDVRFSLSQALLSIQHDAAGSLQATIFAGSVELNSAGELVETEPGMTYIVLLDDSYLAAGTAEPAGLYAFESASQIPPQWVSDTAQVCVAGIATSDEEVPARSDPAADSETVFTVTASSHYTVEQQQTIDDTDWWLISDGEQSGWVEQPAVQVLGDCSEIPMTQVVETPNTGDAENTPSQIQNVSPAQDPASVMMAYLQARLNTNTATMQALSCSAWDSQAIIQAQSFRSMNAELRDVACSTTAQDGSNATVYCSGNIATFYNNQERLWPLGSYHLVIEGGQWRMCGEG